MIYLVAKHIPIIIFIINHLTILITSKYAYKDSNLQEDKLNILSEEIIVNMYKYLI